jgi:hypothetical protein
MSTYSSIELIILDLRQFIDEAISFLECKKTPDDEMFPISQEMTNNFSSQSKSNRQKGIDSKEFVILRQNAIEYTRLIFDLKHLLQDSRLYAEFNTSLKFSDQFKSKRLFFFRNVFKRLEHIYLKISSESIDELVIFYFQIVRHLSRKTNEFIAYLEFSRWQRSYALNVLDKLVNLCNDFLCVLEKIVESIRDEEIEQKTPILRHTPGRNSLPRKELREKLVNILRETRHNLKQKLIKAYSNHREKLKSSRLFFWLSILFLVSFISLIIFTCLSILMKRRSNHQIVYSIDLNNMFHALNQRFVHKRTIECKSVGSQGHHLIEFRKEIHFQICLNDLFDLIFKCFMTFSLLFLVVQKFLNILNR